MMYFWIALALATAALCRPNPALKPRRVLVAKRDAKHGRGR
jgi:hypothetical protein